MKLLYTFILLSTVFVTFAQSIVNSSISTWKNNQKAAYTLTHDDFGMRVARGIEDYADTIAANRGIKIAFGAYVEVCDANDWKKAKEMISRGHEIMNHTYSHKCGNPNAQKWCTDNGVWFVDDFDVELDQTTVTITEETGTRPRFFIYPFDQFTQTTNNYLVNNLNYVGTRTGPYDQRASSVNPDNMQNPEYPGFWVTRPETPSSDLNNYIRDYLNNGGWGVREFHGVSDSSWGTVTVEAYRNHIDYIAAKQAKGELWVGTTTEVITYIKQRNAYTSTAKYNGKNSIEVSFNNPDFDFGNYIGARDYSSPLTINVDISNILDFKSITQNGQPISDYSVNGSQLSINAYPMDGSIFIRKPSDCKDVCFLSQSNDQLVLEGSKITLSYEVETSNDKTITEWYKNGKLISNSGLRFEIAELTPEDTGSYFVKVSNGITTKQSSPISVKIYSPDDSREPYNGFPTVLPGILEVENFDKGDAGVTYKELNGQYDPSYNPYRASEKEVDIESISDGNGYSVGYTNAGEWLEYTVNINTTGTYDLTFRVASASSRTQNSSLNLLVDGESKINDLKVPVTGGWTSWSDLKIEGISLTKGLQVIRLEFKEGDFNINHINFELDEPITFIEDNAIQKTYYTVLDEGSTSLYVLDKAQVKIISTTGQLLATTQTISSGAIDLKNSLGLAPGLYIALIEINNKVYKQKIIIN